VPVEAPLVEEVTLTGVNLWIRRSLGAGISILALGALAAVQGHGPGGEATAAPAQFSPVVNNPYVPLSTVPVTRPGG
jgi:hypothetical protein